MAIANAKIRILSGNTLLPSPDELTRGHEIIWSANTGRSVDPSDGAKMIGDVIAQKQSFQIHWGYLTQAEYNSILSNLSAGFKPFTLILGSENITVTAYRGTLTGTLGGYYGNQIYYKEANVNIIQQ